ncbi:hypothetical protein Y1Q_0001414 [Alligator mississippiensis]|uniref:Uncharacterized protein n=1 Tax=Alligator mississippiensis TaxID=8496 RepID=A0A151M9B6_ALLMI|nr:hypothetical protein Y1Q_0001414 [Alligator mississippiensis]
MVQEDLTHLNFCTKSAFLVVEILNSVENQDDSEHGSMPQPEDTVRWKKPGGLPHDNELPEMYVLDQLSTGILRPGWGSVEFRNEMNHELREVGLRR